MAAKIVVADATVDGTTDFKPLRSKQYDIRKTHISELPVTWKNWYKHINWLNTTFILLIHFAGMIAAYWVPLHFKTLIFAIVYYFNTGLGITAGTSFFLPGLVLFLQPAHHWLWGVPVFPRDRPC